jgi:hypothetical protein
MSRVERIEYLAAEAPYGDIFPRLTSADDAERLKLSDEQVQVYRENGVIMPGFDPITRGEVIEGGMFPLVIDTGTLI